MNKILLIALITLFSANSMATCWSCSKPDSSQDQSQDQEVIVNVDATTSITNNYTIDNDAYMQAEETNKLIATVSAMSAIPHVGHKNKGHDHTAVGFGVGSSGSEQAFAIGLMRDFDDIAVKASVAKASGADAVAGIGISFSF